MDNMVKECRKTLNLFMTTANRRRFKSLKQILTKYTNEREWNLEVNNDREFKAILKYESIPIVAFFLEDRGDESTFSFVPFISGYLYIHGFSGKLTTTRDWQQADVIQTCQSLTRLSNGDMKVDDCLWVMRLENIPNRLEVIINKMITEIDNFSNIVERIEEIQVNIPCTMKEYRNNPARGEFMTAGSSNSFEVSFTIENQTYIYSMKSRHTNRSAQTEYVEMIIPHIRHILLDDCYDIICRTNYQSIASPKPDYYGRTTHRFEFTYSIDNGRKFGISIEESSGKIPCIILNMNSKEEKATRYKVFYEPTNPREENEYQYITINDVEQVSNEQIDKFRNSRWT